MDVIGMSGQTRVRRTSVARWRVRTSTLFVELRPQPSGSSAVRPIARDRGTDEPASRRLRARIGCEQTGTRGPCSNLEPAHRVQPAEQHRNVTATGPDRYS